MAARYLALNPFLAAMSQVVGPELSAKMKDADVLIPKIDPWNRFQIVKRVPTLDPRFTVNMEAKCGVTFKEGDDVYTLNITNDHVAMYLPEGTLLDDVLKLDVTPLPFVVEAIKLKLFAAGDRLILKKAINDLDDIALLLKKSWEKNIEMAYADDAEREKAKYAFDSIWIKYENAKRNSEGGTVWTESDWRGFLKLN